MSNQRTANRLSYALEIVGLSREALGANIAACRQRAKLSKADLARAVAVDRANVTLWERGDTSPSYENLEKVAEACKVTVRKLLRAAPTDAAAG